MNMSLFPLVTAFASHLNHSISPSAASLMLKACSSGSRVAPSFRSINLNLTKNLSVTNKSSHVSFQSLIIQTSTLKANVGESFRFVGQHQQQRTKVKAIMAMTNGKPSGSCDSPKPAIDLSSVTKTELTKFLGDIDAVMFDCDGVLWLGNEPLSHSQDLVIKLRQLGKKIFFMTNNSTSTREEFLVKFNKLGYQATVDEIIGTSYLAALHLKELGFQKKAYVIGTAGITQELEKVGIQSLPIGPDVVSPAMDRWGAKDFEGTELDPDVGAVVVGFDHHFSYLKILKAASYIVNQKCLFIATNTDEQFPSRGERNLTFPGTGSFVRSVETAAGHKAKVMGKPESFPFEIVSRHHHLIPSRVLMVGDRGNTDILFGRKCGLWTLLVMTGVTSPEEMHRWETSSDSEEKLCVPDFYLDSVGQFYGLITNL